MKIRGNIDYKSFCKLNCTLQLMISYGLHENRLMIGFVSLVIWKVKKIYLVSKWVKRNEN